MNLFRSDMVSQIKSVQLSVLRGSLQKVYPDLVISQGVYHGSSTDGNMLGDQAPEPFLDIWNPIVTATRYLPGIRGNQKRIVS